MITTITDINEMPSDCILIVGGESCNACKLMYDQIEKSPLTNVFYIDIKNCFNYVNRLSERPKSLPIIIKMVNGKSKKVAVGNISITKLIQEFINDFI